MLSFIVSYYIDTPENIYILLYSVFITYKRIFYIFVSMSLYIYIILFILCCYVILLLLCYFILLYAKSKIYLFRMMRKMGGFSVVSLVRRSL